MADDKKFDLNATCPMCGCSVMCSLSEDEMRNLFDDPNTAKLKCESCRHVFETPMKNACLDWDDFCQTEFSRFG